MLVDFWTYTCINCIRTLPYLKAWDAAYRKDGLTIVGVETPEFAFEKDAGNVKDAIEQFGIRYPVVQDNNMGTWNAYGNEVLAGRLPDRRARATSATRPFGEGDYSKTETAIRALLAESGAQVGGKSHPTDVVVPSEEATPETYLGTNRAQGWINGPKSGTHDYGPPPTGELALNDFAYSGTWNIAGQPAEAVSEAGHRPGVRGQARLPRAQLARRTPAAVQVLLDGRPISAADAGCRRPRRRRHRPPPAPVLARLAAPRRTAPPVAALRAGGHGLRVHVRVAVAAHARSRTGHDVFVMGV